MNLAVVLAVIASIASGALPLDGPGVLISGPVPHGDEHVISSTPGDVDADGMDETIEIVVADGRLYEWPSPYCGGGERWEGRFEIRVRDGEELLCSQSLNALMAQDSLFFWAPQFEVELGDYNGDGLIDFNLKSSEGGCNGNNYRLFTIDREGGVRSLSSREFYAAPPHTNSTSCIVAMNGLLAVISYSQETGTYVTDWYAWQDDDWILVRREAPYDPK